MTGKSQLTWIAVPMDNLHLWPYFRGRREWNTVRNTQIMWLDGWWSAAICCPWIFFSCLLLAGYVIVFSCYALLLSEDQLFKDGGRGWSVHPVGMAQFGSGWAAGNASHGPGTSVYVFSHLIAESFGWLIDWLVLTLLILCHFCSIDWLMIEWGRFMCPSIRWFIDWLIAWLCSNISILLSGPLFGICFRHGSADVRQRGPLLWNVREWSCFSASQLAAVEMRSIRLSGLMAFLSFRYPPKTFIPPLCAIFLDVSAPDSILEVTARALTYYLDVSQECTRRILSVGSFYTHAFVFHWLKFTHYFSCVLTLSNHVYAETIFSPVTNLWHLNLIDYLQLNRLKLSFIRTCLILEALLRSHSFFYSSLFNSIFRKVFFFRFFHFFFIFLLDVFSLNFFCFFSLEFLVWIFCQSFFKINLRLFLNFDESWFFLSPCD